MLEFSPRLGYSPLTGIFLKSVDMFNEDVENQPPTDRKASMKPLLKGNREDDAPPNASEV